MHRAAKSAISANISTLLLNLVKNAQLHSQFQEMVNALLALQVTFMIISIMSVLLVQETRFSMQLLENVLPLNAI